MIKAKRIGLDTNIFIYYFQEHPQFGVVTKNLFDNFASHKTKAITSILTLTELLSIHASEKDVNNLQALFLETPELTIYDINQNIGVTAARIRRNYGFRLPDAIQLATCLYAKVNTFITNDQKLQSFKEITVTLLSQLS